MGSAGYNARKKARRKASRGSASGAVAWARLAVGAAASARRAGRPKPSLGNRRELEDALVDKFMNGPLPAHAVGNPSFREFLRTRARTLPDEALAARCNLASGDGDNAAMSRDAELVMGDLMDGMTKMPK